MKKKLLMISALVLLGAMSITACNNGGTISSDSDSSSSISSEVVDSEEISSSEIIDSEDSASEESSEVAPFLKTIEISDNHEGDYIVGESFFRTNKLTFTAIYSDSSTFDITSDVTFRIEKITPPRNGTMATKQSFRYAGRHVVTLSYNYNNKEYIKTIDVDVLSGLALNYSCKSIEILNLPKASIGHLYSPSNELTLKVTWTNNVVEYITYVKELDRVKVSLFDINDLNKDIISLEIKKGVTYILKVTIGDVSITTDVIVQESLGYTKLVDYTMLARDVNRYFSPSLGTLNVLVIPIELPSDGYPSATWDEESLLKANREMFGKKEESNNMWNSLKSYYETASFNKLKISGLVADPFIPEDKTLTLKTVNEDYTLNNLYRLMVQAVAFTENSMSEVNWSEFDENNDGKLDAVHFITNALDNSHFIDWSSPLWPHMGNTHMTGTHDRPLPDVYSISSKGHFKDASTQIHEQGHMLGLEDYYDYSYSGSVSYTGGYDMQDDTTCDWNSFSKMNVGWINPYVVTGELDETNITLSAASLNGDALIIPADYKTFNNSPFDEYILIELFSSFNNNQYHMETYPAIGEYGVKLYHVDARLWAYSGDSKKLDEGYEVKDRAMLNKALDENLKVYPGCNNSYIPSEYALPCPTIWNDYNLLTVLRKSNSYNGRLTSDDLYQEGDVFTFDKYNRLFSKKKNERLTMDNGEIFPYEITFNKMNKEEVNITIKKIK